MAEQTTLRTEVTRYVARLLDYGKGEHIPEFDHLTLGEVADQIIAIVQADRG